MQPLIQTGNTGWAEGWNVPGNRRYQASTCPYSFARRVGKRPRAVGRVATSRFAGELPVHLDRGSVPASSEHPAIPHAHCPAHVMLRGCFICPLFPPPLARAANLGSPPGRQRGPGAAAATASTDILNRLRAQRSILPSSTGIRKHQRRPFASLRVTDLAAHSSFGFHVHAPAMSLPRAHCGYHADGQISRWP